MSNVNSEKRIKFKGPLLIVRTEKFLTWYDKIGPMRITRYSAWIMLYMLPVITGFGLLLLFTTLFYTLIAPAAREAARELGPTANLLIPGINPIFGFSPITIIFAWISIVVAIIVHEGGHGVVARSLGFRVKSSGLIFLGIIPIGAFVEVDETGLKSGRARDSGRVLAAGPGSNIITAVLSLIMLIVILSTITPAIPNVKGILLVDVLDGRPAWDSGLRRGDIIVEVNGFNTETVEELSSTLGLSKAGDKINIAIVDSQGNSKEYQVLLEDTPNGPQIGVRVVSSEVLFGLLDSYRDQAIKNPLIHLIPPNLMLGHPLSDSLSTFYTSSSGEFFFYLAKFFYWLWFINISVAIFNALPILPLDGGHALLNLLRKTVGKKWKEESVLKVSGTITMMLFFTILFMILAPYLF